MYGRLDANCATAAVQLNGAYNKSDATEATLAAYAKAPDSSGYIAGTLNDLSGVISAIQENLEDLAGKIGPVLYPDLRPAAKDVNAVQAVTCDLDARLRKQVDALTIINDALISLRHRVAL